MNGDVQRFVYRRGEGARRRVMHLAGYNRLGRFSGVLCGSQLDFNTSCNLPLGRPVCRKCCRVEARFVGR
jgi:hypothetical protein